MSKIDHCFIPFSFPLEATLTFVSFVCSLPLDAIPLIFLDSLNNHGAHRCSVILNYIIDICD